jgi:hypothetical protein
MSRMRDEFKFDNPAPLNIQFGHLFARGLTILEHNRRIHSRQNKVTEVTMLSVVSADMPTNSVTYKSKRNNVPLASTALN